ncbi:amylo-alpha-1,6-glucosidase [Novosphingobium profundi]|nr:amylo-alpha-1,6-glucosidase [Novosphingobium profundi]
MPERQTQAETAASAKIEAQVQRDEAKVADAQFFVPPSASIQERQPRALRSGDAFALFDTHGDALGAMHGPEGVYYRDTRHLSYWRLTLCGEYPMLLGSSMDDRVDALIVDLTNPDIVGRDKTLITNDAIHINRTKFLFENRMHERIAIRNFDEEAHHVRIEITMGSDFKDMFEVRGTHRSRRGDKLAPHFPDGKIVHRYRGLDDVERKTIIAFSPHPAMLQEHRAEFHLDLAPGERRVLFCAISFEDEHELPADQAFLQCYRALRQRRRSRNQQRPRIASTNAGFDAMVSRAVSDLATLTSTTADGLCAYAGIPWYCTLFGRDSLITALELLWFDPAFARGTLLRLAELQATEDDPLADAEPGKILHETRQGEMANLREVPFGLYYGSVDSTPLFIHLAGEYLRRTGDMAAIDRLWPHLQAALGWLDDYADRDGDGFLEYGARSGDGLRNQGWKDSFDAISHADGRLAEGPIAIVEMQAYAYAAWRAAAAICASRGDDAGASHWKDKARDMKRRFAETFFDPELGCYILALDGEKTPCRVVASNAGHALLMGIATPDHADAVAQRLMAPDCFSGWGIRTLSRSEKRYNPMSYHNGSIWPHDNALIAAGFARYGRHADAGRVLSALSAATAYFDQNRLPELFCGFVRKRGRAPILYPVACAPQAWSSASPLFLVQAVLGMDIDHRSTIIFNGPQLPDCLSALTIERIGCGAGTVDLDIQQVGHATSVFVKRRSGGITVNTFS